ncbi:uncharacterized protein LOC142348198 [Convolutriloba macropyga]|uniref:uncharacterized protein LOC142348198 n=1 Tax=Convolutriloba macropyga TaxID=536237 RepID=UPI003F51EBC0
MDPYYMSYASGYDPYYSAIHAYSQEVARSARDEIEKQAEDLRNFRKAMLAQELDNEKLKSVSSKLHSEIQRLAEDKNKMKLYMENLEQKNRELQETLDVTSEELLTKEARNSEEIKRMNDELIKLNDQKNSLQEKFLKLELEYVQQQKDTEMLVGEKLKAEQSIKHLENSNDLQLSENEKLRTRLKRERDARVMLEEWEKKRLQRLAMLDPLARVVPGSYYPSYHGVSTLHRPPFPPPPPVLDTAPTSDVLTKLKLLENELQAEAEAARNRSGKIAQGWGSRSAGANMRASAAGSSSKGL